MITKEQRIEDEPPPLYTGTYWRVRAGVERPDGIKTEWILLLESVKIVDDEPHTLVLRGHPSEIDTYNDHKRSYLVGEFLDTFEFVPEQEAKEIRQREILKIQGKINTIQQQISAAAIDPSVMQADVDNGIRAWEKKQHLRLGASAKIEAPTSALISLNSDLTQARIDGMKLALNRQSEVAQIQAKWMSTRAEELGKTVNAITPYITEQAVAAISRTEGIRRKIDKLYNTIGSLDLYVGKDVDVETITTGADASADVPLSIKQSKIFMDEEFSVWADVDSKFDFSSEKHFFDALKISNGLVEQIFPTERSIICMQIRRDSIHYTDNVVHNAMLNQRNKEVFLLVRNGGNIHKVWSPVESHLRSHRLFPTKAEIDSIFEARGKYNPDTGESETLNVNFMDTRYADRLDIHESVALHYKRFLILLAGLDHRLNLFGTFYTEPKSLSFVTEYFQNRYLNMISDDDVNALQVDGDRAMSFADWITSKNDFLRSGSRVICYWRKVMTNKSAPAAVRQDQRGNDYTAYDAKDEFSVVIAARRGSEIFVTCPVSGFSYSTHGDREFEASVNLSIYQSYSHRGFGFLVLDAVKPDELDYYIHSRVERVNHTKYIRLFKRAIKFLRDEEQRQSITRARLIDALHTGCQIQGSEAESLADTAIMTYRAAARGAELPASTDPGYRQLLNQMFQLSKGETRIQEAKTIAVRFGLEPLRLVVSGRSTMRLYCAPRPSERDDRLIPHSWTRALTCQQCASGLRVVDDTWREIQEKNAAETVIQEWSGAKEWTNKKSPFSHAEKQALLKTVESFTFDNAWLKDSVSEEEFLRLFNHWKSYRSNWQVHSRNVVNPCAAVPFGMAYHAEGRWCPLRVEFLCISTDNAAGWLYRLAPNESLRKDLLDKYSAIYHHSRDARKRLIKDEDKWATRQIFSISVSEELDDCLCKRANCCYGKFQDKESFYKQLAIVISKMKKDYISVYVAPSVGFDESTNTEEPPIEESED